MQSKTTIAGHAVHPMLVLFPVLFYVSAFVAFITHAVTHSFFWWEAALWCNLLGVGAALIAAIPGAIDLFGVIPPYHAARPVGVVHMSLSLAALSLFVANLAVQQGAWAQMPARMRVMFHLAHMVKPDVTLALVLSGGGVLVTIIAGFFGWTLVAKHRVGIRAPRDEVLEGRLNPPVAPVFPITR